MLVVGRNTEQVQHRLRDTLAHVTLTKVKAPVATRVEPLQHMMRQQAATRLCL